MFTKIIILCISNLWSNRFFKSFNYMPRHIKYFKNVCVIMPNELDITTFISGFMHCLAIKVSSCNFIFSFRIICHINLYKSSRKSLCQELCVSWLQIFPFHFHISTTNFTNFSVVSRLCLFILVNHFYVIVFVFSLSFII